MSGITAILPAFNEKVSIGSSSDRTAEVIGHLQNREKGAALKMGFELLNSPDAAVDGYWIRDTDGQHN